MKHFKNSAEADKAWNEIVYKMKEAESKDDLKQFENKVNSIIGDKRLNVVVPKKGTIVKRSSSKKEVKGGH